MAMRAAICFLMMVFAGAAFAQDAKNRVALVIGNAAYSRAALANPVNDANGSIDRELVDEIRSLALDVCQDWMPFWMVVVAEAESVSPFRRSGGEKGKGEGERTSTSNHMSQNSCERFRSILSDIWFGRRPLTGWVRRVSIT